jgi:hypothetical protein
MICIGTNTVLDRALVVHEAHLSDVLHEPMTGNLAL